MKTLQFGNHINTHVIKVPTTGITSMCMQKIIGRTRVYGFLLDQIIMGDNINGLLN